MLPEEKDAVEKFFERSLGLIDRIVFGISFEEALKSAKEQRGDTLVAEHNSEIVGTVSMQIQQIKSEFAGFVDALATPQRTSRIRHRHFISGKCFSRLEKRSCTTIYATADRYNRQNTEYTGTVTR